MPAADATAADPVRAAAPVIAAVAATLLFWASAFAAIRFAVRDLAPESLVLLRFAVCAVAWTALLAPRLRSLGGVRLRRREALGLVAMGVCGAAGYNLLLAHGQRSVSAVGAALLINTVPIWTALLAAKALGERLRARAWLGVGVGFAGAAVVSWGEAGWSADGAGAIAVLGAALLQAVYFVVLRSMVVRVGVEAATLATFWVGAAALAPWAGRLLADLATAPGSAVAAVVYLGLGPSAIGASLWAYALRRVPASRLTVFLYLVPPLAALVAWLGLGEVPAPRVAAGGAISLAGVALVARSGARARRRTRRATAVAAATCNAS